MLTNDALREVFEKTRGHCHFCGDPLRWRAYGANHIQLEKGAWVLDHVIQKGKGGPDSSDNYLPACSRCNSLRWHRKGKQLRELLVLGLVAKDEIKKGSGLGRTLRVMALRREMKNARRRRPLSPA